MEYIKKSCTYIEDESVTLSYEDTRDDYIYDDYLGVVGFIEINPDFCEILPIIDYNYTKEQEIISQEILKEEFKKIFNITEEDYKKHKPIYYFYKIQRMIVTGELSKLGYKIKKENKFSINLEENNIPKIIR